MCRTVTVAATQMACSWDLEANIETVERLVRDETEEGVLVHRFDLDQLEHIRSAWGSFRDRRPNLYGTLKTLDGSMES